MEFNKDARKLIPHKTGCPRVGPYLCFYQLIPDGNGVHQPVQVDVCMGCGKWEYSHLTDAAHEESNP
jgi:hypothetical protein